MAREAKKDPNELTVEQKLKTLFQLQTMLSKIDEIKTICWFCSKKATMVIRTIDGQPVYEGKQLQIGGNETYIPVCRKHYFKPEL